MIEYALELSAVSVFVGDATLEAPAMHVSNHTTAVVLPRVDGGQDTFAEAVLDAARAHSIDLVVPLSDLELMSLARHKQAFIDAGVCVVVSDPDVIAVTMNKKNATAHCRANHITVPVTAFSAAEYDGPYPCIIKPVEGSASAGLSVVEERGDLMKCRDGLDMIQARIDGTEYGIDILNDLAGDFVCATVKEKLLMRAGETDRSKIVKHARLQNLSEVIARTFRHIGNMDVDVIVDYDGNIYCIDFNARFGGGYPTTHAAGMNYLAALVDMAKGNTVKLPPAPLAVTVVKGISVHMIAASP